MVAPPTVGNDSHRRPACQLVKFDQGQSVFVLEQQSRGDDEMGRS